MINQYYDKDLDIDGSADTLFIQARNGYISNIDALRRIEEILRGENKYEQAEYVGILREIEEFSQSGKNPMFPQFKKDILDGCGSEEIRLRDGLSLNVLNDRGEIVISLQEDPTDDFTCGRCGGFLMPVGRFMKLNAKEFDELVNSLYAHGMIECDE